MKKALRKAMRRVHVRAATSVQDEWLLRNGIKPRSRKERDREFHKLMAEERKTESDRG